MRFSPGSPVRCETRKWPDLEHWSFFGVYLGEDSYGEWLGFPAGTHNRRPGHSFDSKVDSVTLVPHDRWWIATFHDPGIWCDLYIDVCTPVEWEGDVARCVDLDLDVIRMTTDPMAVAAQQIERTRPGEIFIDDEDEFAEHQVSLGYPADVVARARSAADDLLVRVGAGDAPFDGTALPWLQTLRSTTARTGDM